LEPENTLKSKDFTDPGGGLAPIAPHPSDSHSEIKAPPSLSLCL